MFNITTILRLLPVVGEETAAGPEFKTIYEELSDLFGTADQAMLKEAYADMIAGDAAGRARLQAKLKAAAGQ